MNCRKLEPSERRERLQVTALLALMSATFFAYAIVFIPRLTNNHFGDVEFTGWVLPIGERFLSGERPYRDFVLPIPPGSFVLLALIARVVGRPLLLEELWVNELAHWAMALLAYVIARPLTTRANALFVSLCTLVTIIQLNKEIPYDHTALLVAWASVATGIRGLLADVSRARSRWWLLTGALSALSIYFKQSTGLGAIGGWGIALAYLAAVEAVSRQPEALRYRLSDAAAWLFGTAIGTVLVIVGVLAVGASLGDFFQAVFLDGPDLKGGSGRLLVDLLMYLVAYDAFPAPPLFVVLLVIVGARIALVRRTLHIGDEPLRTSVLDARSVAALGLATVATFGAAIGLLLSGYHGIEREIVLWMDRLAVIAMLGFAFGCAFFVAHLTRTARPSSPLVADRVRVGHAINALLLSTLVASLLHNTSAPELRSFYDNNPVIPVVFVALFVALDRARLGWVKALAVLLTLVSLFGNKLDRGIRAERSVGRRGYWAGMHVNERGVEIVRAALRARELSADNETVLVLPEDVNLAALIGRPRPHLRGAILYVDQYPNRLVDDDLRRLRKQPPKVIIIHPRQHLMWARVFRTWSGDSGTEKVLRFVQSELLPQRYRLDSSYPTHFLWGPATLDVYERRD